MLDQFLSTVYSEEIFNHTEDDEQAMAELIASEQMEGYGEWSAALEDDPVVTESENFTVTASGKVRHKPEPASKGRIGGYEL